MKTLSWTDRLLLILGAFTATFFIYRDFGFRMIFGFGALALILALQFLRRTAIDRPLEPKSGEIAFGFLALVVLLNFLRPDSAHHADAISYILAMLICTAFLWLHRSDRSEGRKLLRLLWIGAAAMAVFSLICTMNKDFFQATLYPYLTPVAQHYLDYFVPKGYGIALGGYTFADYLLFAGMAVCFAWMVKADKLWKKGALLLCAGVFLFVILILGRRGELLGAVLCCGVLMLILCTRRQRIAIILGGGGLLAIALGLFFRYLPQLREIDIFYRYVRTIENMVNGYDFTSGRTDLFLRAIRGFRSAPVFGIGFDQYVTLTNPLLTDIEGKVISDAHNIYLQMLCETGIVGTALTLLPMGYLFVTTCRLLRRAKRMEDRDVLSLTIVSFLLQMNLLVLGLYDPTFQKIIFWCYYAMAMMLLRSAMDLACWQPAGPVSRLWERIGTLLAVPGRKVWKLLRTPWKEGNP